MATKTLTQVIPAWQLILVGLSLVVSVAGVWMERKIQKNAFRKAALARLGVR